MKTAAFAWLVLFFAVPAFGQTVQDYMMARNLDLVKVFGPYEIRDFSKGGPDDPPEIEFNKLKVISQEFDWKSHIVFVVGATDTTRWVKKYAPKERYTLDNNLGLSRGSKVYDWLVKNGVDSLKVIQLPPKHWAPFRGAYIYVVKVEPMKPAQPEPAEPAVINHYYTTVIGDTSKHTVLSPLSVGVGVEYWAGKVVCTLPTVSLRLKLMDNIFLQYSFGYWEKSEADKFGSRSFVGQQGSVLWFPLTWAGVEIGASVVEERIRSENQFLQQEAGLFLGARLRFGLSENLSLEGFGKASRNNLNQFGVSPSGEYTGSVGVQLTFTPSL
jgi:hypothetical protein